MSDALEDLARANKLVSWHVFFCGTYRLHKRLTRFNLVINCKMAHFLRLTISQQLLIFADEVIE